MKPNQKINFYFQIYQHSHSIELETERELSYDLILKIIDIILLNETSLNKQVVIV